MRKKMRLWKSVDQELRDWIRTAVVVLCGLVFAVPQAAWKNRVIAEVSVGCPATVDVDGAAFGGGASDIAGVEGCRVEENRCASVTDKVLRRAEVVSLKWKSFCGLCRTGQNAEGMCRIIYICQVIDDG